MTVASQVWCEEKLAKSLTTRRVLRWRGLRWDRPVREAGVDRADGRPRRTSPAQLRWDETSAVCPEDVYDETKLRCEHGSAARPRAQKCSKMPSVLGTLPLGSSCGLVPASTRNVTQLQTNPVGTGN